MSNSHVRRHITHAAHTGTVLVLVLLSGCVFLSSHPKHDSGFVAASSLSSFDGCYEELGHPREQPVYRLSALVWRRENERPDDVDALGIRASGRRLQMTAFAAQKPVAERMLVEGRDFRLTHGRLQLPSHTYGSMVSPEGNVFIGALHESTTLGLDRASNVRLKSALSFGGTAFLAIPVAGHARDVRRFDRSDTLCQEDNRDEVRDVQ